LVVVHCSVVTTFPQESPLQGSQWSYPARISKAATKARRSPIETESTSADVEVDGQTFFEV
jgi:hypothetical protein